MFRIYRVIGVFLPFLLFTSLSAQQGDTFRTQSNLVLVPVEVRNHNQHVSGLEKDKFAILEDGKPQKIAVFEEVRTTTDHLQRVPVGPQQFSNEFSGNEATARYTIIAIDRINTTTMDMQRLRQGLLKFLDQAADSGEPMRLIAINPTRIEVIQDFTTDPKVLLKALQTIKTPAGKITQNSNTLNETLDDMANLMQQSAQAAGSDPSASVAVHLAQLDDLKAMEQTQIAYQQRSSRLNSLEALQMVAKTLTSLPGRKSLVWASSGYPFAINVQQTQNSAQDVKQVQLNYSQVIEAGALDAYTMQLMNAANIALYPVDARGTVNTAWDVMDPSHKYSPSYAEKEGAQMANQEVRATFEHLAAATGGRPCVERTDLSGCFKDALEDARDYYMVGFYADADTKPGWHKLQVKVSADANVRSRAGFMYAVANPAETQAHDMRLELGTYLLDPGIPFRGQWSLKEPKGDKKDVSFEMHILPAANVVIQSDPHLNLDIAAIARAKDGSIAGQFAQKIDRQLPPAAISTIMSSGIDYHNVMNLGPGKYVVRLVVRDNNTGRMGSATTLVQVD